MLHTLINKVNLDKQKEAGITLYASCSGSF